MTCSVPLGEGKQWVPKGADGHPGCPLVPPRAAPESAGGRACWCNCRCVKTIGNLRRIKMVVARASGMELVSTLK